MTDRIPRRRFLHLSAEALGLAALAACGFQGQTDQSNPAIATPTSAPLPALASSDILDSPGILQPLPLADSADLERATQVLANLPELSPQAREQIEQSTVLLEVQPGKRICNGVIPKKNAAIVLSTQTCIGNQPNTEILVHYTHKNTFSGQAHIFHPDLDLAVVETGVDFAGRGVEVESTTKETVGDFVHVISSVGNKDNKFYPKITNGIFVGGPSSLLSAKLNQDSPVRNNPNAINYLFFVMINEPFTPLVGAGIYDDNGINPNLIGLTVGSDIIDGRSYIFGVQIPK